MSQTANQRPRSPARDPANKDTPVAPTPEDLALENDLVLLLAQMEQFRTALEGLAAQKRADQVVETATAMVNHVTAFAEKRLSSEDHAEALAIALAKAGDFFTSAHSLAPPARGGTLRSFFGFLGRGTVPVGPTPALGEVLEVLLEVVKSYLGLFTNCFSSPTVAANWTETYGVFLADLKWVLDRLGA